MIFNNSRELALELDNKDPLLSYNDKFHFPVQENGNKHIYLCGNSLGLQAKITESFVKQELDDWKALGVEGHFHAQNPWLPYHEFLSESYSKIVGSKKSEVIAMNTLSVNLHLMMVSFYRPNETKNKIIIEGDAFPSDIYAVESHMKHHGIDPSESLIKLRPREGEVIIRLEDIINVMEQNSESVSLIMLGGVNYYTGQLFDMKKITQVAHNHGILVGFDLAHAVGNVLLSLHDWNVDFAVWCSYKYLNSGPGTVAGAFMGTTTVTSYVESGAGVKAGGRTGMTSLVIGVLFLACLFFAPLATSLPKEIDGAALLYVAVLFVRNITDIEWDDIAESAPAVLAMIAMPLTYSISNGIALAFISYALIKVFTGKFSTTSPAIWVIAILSAISFAVA
ncbi:MAG: kynureninase [Euryarchaeota archaeon]|nr:kynureninase [Euryarchaeota archaeon]